MMLRSTLLSLLVAVVASQGTPCEVCGAGREVTIDAIFEFPGQPPVSCSLLESHGVQGSIPAESCPFLPDLIDTLCGCADINFGAPTDPPITLAPGAQIVSEPTPVPTSFPTAPTFSPNPTTQFTPVLIRINMDGRAQEIGWRIEDASGTTVAGVEMGGYELSQAFSTILEERSLMSGAEYTFTLLDSSGDGLYNTAYIYLGNRIDETQIIGHYDVQFSKFDHSHSLTFLVSPDGILDNLYPTISPSITPSGEPSAPTVSAAPSIAEKSVLLVLTLDHFPSEIGWRIERADGDIVQEINTGTYSGSYGSERREEFILSGRNNDYVFVLVDTYGDGLQQPAILYLGNVEDPGNILAYYDGVEGFRYEWRAPIDFYNPLVGIVPTAAPSAPTVAPSSFPTAPTVSPGPTVETVQCFLEIEIEFSPQDKGWVLAELDTGVVVHEVVAGEYQFGFTTYVTTLELKQSQTYQLTLLDAFGGGYCCGSFTIYYGDEADPGKVLLHYDPPFDEFFTTELTLDFTVSELATIVVFPTASPTTAAPTSPRGEHAPCNVCGNATVVTNPDGVFNYTADVYLRCGTLEEHGAQGLISKSFCESLPALLNVTCGCSSVDAVS